MFKPRKCLNLEKNYLLRLHSTSQTLQIILLELIHHSKTVQDTHSYLRCFFLELHIFSASHPCITWDKNWPEAKRSWLRTQEQNTTRTEHFKTKHLKNKTLQQTSIGGPSTIPYSPTILFPSISLASPIPGYLHYFTSVATGFPFYITIVITGTIFYHITIGTLSVLLAALYLLQWHTDTLLLPDFFRTYVYGTFYTR